MHQAEFEKGNDKVVTLLRLACSELDVAVQALCAECESKTSGLDVERQIASLSQLQALLDVITDDVKIVSGSVSLLESRCADMRAAMEGWVHLKFDDANAAAEVQAILTSLAKVNTMFQQALVSLTLDDVVEAQRVCSEATERLRSDCIRGLSIVLQLEVTTSTNELFLQVL